MIRKSPAQLNIESLKHVGSQKTCFTTYPYQLLLLHITHVGNVYRLSLSHGVLFRRVIAHIQLEQGHSLKQIGIGNKSLCHLIQLPKRIGGVGFNKKPCSTFFHIWWTWKEQHCTGATSLQYTQITCLLYSPSNDVKAYIIYHIAIL